MKITFNHLPLGLYTEKMLAEQWTGVTLSRGVTEGRCRIEEIENERVLAVTHQAGKVGPIEGGVSWRYYFSRPSDTYSVEYKVRVGADFDFVKGGKLPGLCGGSSPGGGADTKKADGFSARVMWRELGVLENYLYHMDRQDVKQWGSDYLWLKPCNQGELFDQWETLNVKNDDRVYLTSDRWHTVKNTIIMNEPDQENGQILAWFDGVEVLNMSLRFRKDTSFSIDSFRFTTFFGGNDASWAPTKDERIYFKDIIITDNLVLS